jgi:hypothetical protein
MANGTFILALILLLAVPAFADEGNGTPVFKDDFNNGNVNDWQMITMGDNGPGNWNISNGMLNAATGDYGSGMAVYPDFTLNNSNYTIEADVMVLRSEWSTSMAGAGPNGMMEIGEIEGSRGYFALLSPYNDPGQITTGGEGSMCIETLPMDDGDYQQSNRVCGDVPSYNQLDVWYHMKFERTGPTIRIYRDAQLIAQEDVGAIATNSTPALLFYEGIFEVKNFTVYTNMTPELVIVNGELDAPAAVMQNSTFIASAVVRNDGMVNATGFNVTFYGANGKTECTSRIQQLEVNGSANVSCDINATDAGIRDLSVLADSAGEVQEIDTSGESATARVIVSPQPQSLGPLLTVAAGIVLGLVALGAIFAVYKRATHTAAAGEQLVKCKRCGMMLSPLVKKCPVCGEDIGQA